MKTLQNFLDQNGVSADVLLNRAVYSGNFTLVSFLLKTGGVNINSVDSNGYTPLHIAVQKLDVKIARALLEAGADIDKVGGERGYSPLHMVIAYKAAKRNGFFIKERLNSVYNKQEIKFITSLVSGCKKNELRMLFMLISKGANIDAFSIDGFTPLHLAIFYGRDKIVKMLVAAGANLFFSPSLFVNPRDADTAILSCALLINNANILRFLFDSFSELYSWPIKDFLNSKDIYGNFVLHNILKISDQEVLKVILDYGADINVRGVRGRTVIHLISVFNLPELISFLVENGVGINDRDNYGCTSLHTAINYNHEETAIALVKAGADINIRDNNSYSCFERAIILNQFTLVNFILDYCENIDFDDIDEERGSSILDIVRDSGNYELADKIGQVIIRQRINNAIAPCAGGISRAPLPMTAAGDAPFDHREVVYSSSLKN
jgi:ankyrin repeat protein